jgi:hypothetical protein
MKIDPNEHEYAIVCYSEYGPTFGDDICIVNNAHTRKDSYSNLDHTYKHPQYEYGTDEAESFLAGSHEFQLDEIEVYQKEKQRKRKLKTNFYSAIYNYYGIKSGKNAKFYGPI